MYLQDVIKLKIRTLNVYLSVFGAKTLGIIFISDYQAHGLVLQMLSMTFWTHFLILCIIMLNIEPQIEKIVLHFYKKIQ